MAYENRFRAFYILKTYTFMSKYTKFNIAEPGLNTGIYSKMEVKNGIF